MTSHRARNYALIASAVMVSSALWAGAGWAVSAAGGQPAGHHVRDSGAQAARH